jgi:hypothetical protein
MEYTVFGEGVELSIAMAIARINRVKAVAKPLSAAGLSGNAFC